MGVQMPSRMLTEEFWKCKQPSGCSLVVRPTYAFLLAIGLRSCKAPWCPVIWLAQEMRKTLWCYLEHFHQCQQHCRAYREATAKGCVLGLLNIEPSASRSTVAFGLESA